MNTLKVCSRCEKKRPTKGAILNSKFGHYCSECLASQHRQDLASKAEYSRERDRETYKKDMLQPFLPNGKPNTEFIRAYPERSDNFTEDELKEYG